MPVATKDAVLGSAVDLAREVAIELAQDPADVGEHLGFTVDDERLVSHRFACLARGYRGWEWTVTVARVPRGRSATVCEAELLPGDDAILGKAWVPWSDRLRPGDIGAGDVLPFRADDPRLVPGWTPTGDAELDEVAIDELALARARVLSPLGRDEAADRWYRGAHGPTTPGALAASAACASCGFLVPLQGSLGQLFGVCANEWSPDDGKVVSYDHGCGAHSETDAEQPASEWPAADPLIDELSVEAVDLSSLPAAAAAAADVATPAAEPARVPDEVAEDVVARGEFPAEDAAGQDADAVAEDVVARGEFPAEDAAPADEAAPEDDGPADEASAVDAPPTTADDAAADAPPADAPPADAPADEPATDPEP
ncbi:DUF3027 domain-containing protein [Cellulomonas alba]|uniref:DUF3027 domain-containing protein n=1 Tax=Cellulomonas alba TaxID=3053467 RepID=A0ABT7SGX5_9CELL|nr:DUF3027 domain-containing protein [Cellulomonas alba]MDM7855447.1 DUF3027 domain-containing protein [Cellulomonas alba]